MTPEETDDQTRPVRRPGIIEYVLVLILVAIVVLVALALLAPSMSDEYSVLLVSI